MSIFFSYIEILELTIATQEPFTLCRYFDGIHFKSCIRVTDRIYGLTGRLSNTPNCELSLLVREALGCSRFATNTNPIRHPAIPNDHGELSRLRGRGGVELQPSSISTAPLRRF